MTRLVWGATGERLYEAGVDRGVLFVGSNPGVSWNGLVSISEAPSGAEVEPAFFEGYKYSNRVTPEQFEGTIEAFTYPQEFAVCDGTGDLGLGLFAGQQRRRPFNLAYRTKIGNDVSALDFGYKLHLVYNATAAPSTRGFSTVNATPATSNFSWKFTTKPPKVAGIRPTSHFTLDSRKMPSSLMQYFEDVLYGTETTAARFPTPTELMYVVQAFLTDTYNAKTPSDPQYFTIDAGYFPETQANTLDGGTP